MKRLLTLRDLPLPPNINDTINANRGNAFNGNLLGKNYMLRLRTAIRPQIPEGWEVITHPVFITMLFHHEAYRQDTSNAEAPKYVLDALTMDRQKGPTKNKRTKKVTTYPPPDNSHAILFDDGPAYIPIHPIMLRLPNAAKESMEINIFDFSQWYSVEVKGKRKIFHDEKLDDFAAAITGFITHEV